MANLTNKKQPTEGKKELQKHKTVGEEKEEEGTKQTNRRTTS